MKRILFFNLIMLLLVACSNEDIESSPLANDGETVFTVTVPEETSLRRAASEGDITSLKVVEFDENGLLYSSQEATVVNKAEGKYKVKLTPTSQKRTLHFMANYKGAGLETFGLSEEEIFSQLTTEQPNTVYWQRIELDNIQADTRIPEINLLRNMAKIEVKQGESVSNFSFGGFRVVNTFAKGMIAPYYANPIDEMPDFNLSSMPAFESLTYSGVQPLDAGYWVSSEYSQGPTYVYERNQQGSDPAFILLKGTYGGVTGYYKVNLVYESTIGLTELCNIIRNYCYTVTINSVTAQGYATEAEAISAPASNDLFTSVEVASLRNISDGTARLFVSYTDTVVVRGTKEIELKYKYLSNKTTNTIDNSSVKFSLEEGNLIQSVTASGDVSDGYSKAKIALNDILGEQTFIVYETTSNKLFRKVNVRVRPIERLIASAREANGIISVNFTLPAGLPSSMFPLKFVIEAPEHTISPATGTDMPVVQLDQSYGYIRTVKWDEYGQGAAPTTIESKFSPTVAMYDTDINVSNPYFYITPTEISTGSWAEFGSLQDTYWGDMGKEVVFAFRAKNKEVKFKLENLAPVDGSLVPGSDGTYTYPSTSTLATQYVYLKTTTSNKDGKVIITSESNKELVSKCLPWIILSTQYSFDYLINLSSYNGKVSLRFETLLDKEVFIKMHSDKGTYDVINPASVGLHEPEYIVEKYIEAKYVWVDYCVANDIKARMHSMFATSINSLYSVGGTEIYAEDQTKVVGKLQRNVNDYYTLSMNVTSYNLADSATEYVYIKNQKGSLAKVSLLELMTLNSLDLNTK